MGHRVTAAAVQVAAGRRVHMLDRGELLPTGVDPATIERLTARGFIESVADDESTSSDTPAEPTPEERYQALKVDELKAEIDSRNTGREDAERVSADGKKDDLIAALLADDAKQAE